MENGYMTLCGFGRAEIVEKRSRFIGSCAPAGSEAQALEFIARIKAEFRDASHNVHAFYLRQDGLSRCTDDGEPSGTAGRPVLETLTRAEVQNAAVVVTRYFGGTLLGTGGLVRAYSRAANEAIKAAGIAVYTSCARFRVCCAYPHYEQLLRALGAQGARVEGSDFAAQVTITCLARQQDLQGICGAVTELTGGRARLEVLWQGYHPF